MPKPIQKIPERPPRNESQADLDPSVLDFVTSCQLVNPEEDHKAHKNKEIRPSLEKTESDTGVCDEGDREKGGENGNGLVQGHVPKNETFRQLVQEKDAEKDDSDHILSFSFFSSFS